MLPALDTASHANKGGERETERGSEREREEKTRSGGAHSSFALPIPRPLLSSVARYKFAVMNISQKT